MIHITSKLFGEIFTLGMQDAKLVKSSLQPLIEESGGRDVNTCCSGKPEGAHHESE